MATSRASPARAALDHSFEELYRGHRGDVYRTVLREVGNPHDAEDVTQAAFLDAYRAVLRGSEPQSPRAWLLAIAENVRRRRFRTSQRRPREEPLDADFPLAAELSHELAQTLAEALAGLPDEQRQVFLLREFAGLSYDEIADRVEATVASVQMLLFRARRSLRAQLEPPTVSQRRVGLLVPLPGWLATVVSRIEVAGVAPRVAGAVGATVMTVVGASVAVSQSQADARPAPIVREAPAPKAQESAGKNTSTLVVAEVQRPRGSASRSAPGPAVAWPTRARRPEAGAGTSVGPTAAAVTPAATTVSTAGAPEQAAATALPSVERPQLRLPLPNLQRPLDLPVPPPSPVVPVDLTPGAAGAAGAGAPPLPVPALPPLPLPPA
jgi:RNA polymerase sigma-70 factor, ECF subfamily